MKAKNPDIQYLDSLIYPLDKDSLTLHDLASLLELISEDNSSDDFNWTVLHWIESLLDQKFSDRQTVDLYLDYIERHYPDNQEWCENLFTRLLSAKLSQLIIDSLQRFEDKTFIKHLIHAQKSNVYWIVATRKWKTDWGLSEIEESI